MNIHINLPFETIQMMLIVEDSPLRSNLYGFTVILMKKNIVQITFSFVIIVMFHLLPIKTFAATHVYKITDGINYSAAGSTGNGRVIYYAIFGLDFHGGKVFISRNPDGTGNPSVGDGFQVIAQSAPPTFDYFGHTNCTTFKPDPEPKDISYIMKPGVNSVLFRYQDWCRRPTQISQAYLIYIENDPSPTPVPTSIPTPTATVIPTPVPFLDLPWDYQSKGLTFIDAALSMSSYFDHEYPLLSGGIDEPTDVLGTIISYQNNIRNRSLNYSSHDGYDYASGAKVKLGDSVLAAAAGTARYISSCAPCGNMILIDHANGYETRYLHLQKEGLIASDSASRIPVTAGQTIGKVGFTGHVIPPGKDGAHIHITLVQDKNKDGNFSDNIPDGVTDPFGWKSEEPDPWESFIFNYSGIQKKGNKSYYLWKHPIDEIKGEILPEGGVFTAHKATINIQAGTTEIPLKLNFGLTPIGDTGASLIPIGIGYDIKAYDSIGNPVTNFLQPFHLLIDFISYNLSNIKPETLSIYSSQDGTNWKKEQTTINLSDKKATAEINHLTQFVLMGERLDTIPPITTINLNGGQGENNHFRSDVTLSVSPVDNEGGLGISYTAIKVHAPDTEKDWDIYLEPQTFSSEGEYTIEYYSVDNDSNSEEIKTVTFSIDKTPPEAEIMYDLNSYDLVVKGIDKNMPTQLEKVNLGKNKEKIVITDKAGNTLSILDKDREKGKKAVMNIYSLTYNSDQPVDLGENKLSIDASTNKNNTLKAFNQLFKVKGEQKLELSYSEKTNKTKVIIRVKGQNKEKTELEGIVMLKLITNKGLLIESY